MQVKDKKTRRKTYKTMWKDEYYLLIYQLAREGMKDRGIRRKLHIHEDTWGRWLKRKPALVEALKEARKTPEERGEKTDELMGCIYYNLSPKLQEIWNSIMELELDGSNSGLREGVWDKLQNLGKKARQRLFLYALATSNFSRTEACRKVNLDVHTVNIWMSDPDFNDLVKGILEVKKDFFESALIDLVKAGDANATIFVNRTLNRDRGYSERTIVEVQGSIQHTHEISPDQLSIAARRELLRLMEQKEQLALPKPPGEDTIIDAEFTPVGDNPAPEEEVIRRTVR